MTLDDERKRYSAELKAQVAHQANREERTDEISPRMPAILISLYGDWLWLDDRIDTVLKEIEQISRTEENCVNVMTMPGIGPMISTAMVAAIGTAEAFGRGRDFVAGLA